VGEGHNGLYARPGGGDMENRIATALWLVGEGHNGLYARPGGGVIKNRISTLWLVGEGHNGLSARPENEVLIGAERRDAGNVRGNVGVVFG